MPTPPNPNDDDDTAGNHGGGPISYVFKWLWKYRLSTIKGEPRSLWLIVAMVLSAFALGKLF